LLTAGPAAYAAINNHAAVAGRGRITIVLTICQKTLIAPCAGHQRAMFDREGRLILAHLQDDFPLDPQPYEALSRRLHIPVSRIRSKVQMFCRKGIIRYIGAVVDTKKAGFRSGLVALAVPASRVNAVSKIINNYRQVTHNYLRQGEFNMWFTVICRTERMRAALVSKIRRDTGISMCLDLPTRKVFKIDARFALLDGAGLTARLPMHKKNLQHRIPAYD